MFVGEATIGGHEPVVVRESKPERCALTITFINVVLVLLFVADRVHGEAGYQPHRVYDGAVHLPRDAQRNRRANEREAEGVREVGYVGRGVHSPVHLSRKAWVATSNESTTDALTE